MCCISSRGYEGGSAVGVGIAEDSTSGVVIAGTYSGPGTGPSGALYWPAGSIGGSVVAALTSQGEPRWQHSIAAAGASVTATWVGAVGSNVVVAGSLAGDADLGCGVEHGGKAAAFLVGLAAASGSCVFSTLLPVSTALAGIVAGGDVVLAGPLNADADLGCGVASAGGGGGYVTRRRTTDGSCIWSRATPGILRLGIGTALATDGSSAIYLGASLSKTTTFAGGTLTKQSGSVAEDALLLKYGTDGSETWGMNWGNPSGGGWVTGLAITSDQRVWLAGTFQNEITFGSQTFGAPMASSGSMLFLASTTSAGVLSYAAALSPTSNQPENDIPLALAADSSGALYLESPLDGPLQIGGKMVGTPSGTLLAKLDVSAGVALAASRVLPIGGNAFTIGSCGDLLVTGNIPGGSDVGCGALGSSATLNYFWGRFAP